MAIIYREKIYEGCVDLRNYEVEQHIKDKKTLRVVVGDQFMDIDYKKLKHPLKVSEIIRSKWYPSQYYKLYSYLWKPEKKLSKDEQLKKYVCG